jgi:hypothetical protein
METLAHEADLPDPEDAKAIFAFAMSFNGYERYGSFEKSSALAKQKPRKRWMSCGTSYFSLLEHLGMSEPTDTLISIENCFRYFGRTCNVDVLACRR